MVHVEDVSVAEAFDVFFDGDELLEVLILSRVEYGIVDNDAVDSFILVRRDDVGFDLFSVYLPQQEAEATIDLQDQGMT